MSIEARLALTTCVAVNRHTAQRYGWGEGCDGWHLLQDAALSVIEERVSPGVGERAHRHAHATQCFYMLQGEAVMEFEHNEVVLRVGDSLHVRPGVAHRFTNRSAEDVRFIVVSAPSTHEDRIDVPRWREES